MKHVKNLSVCTPTNNTQASSSVLLKVAVHKLSAFFIAASFVILQAEIYFSTIQGINYYIFLFCLVHTICFFTDAGNCI